MIQPTRLVNLPGLGWVDPILVVAVYHAYQNVARAIPHRVVVVVCPHDPIDLFMDCDDYPEAVRMAENFAHIINAQRGS
jgi:hypothetical protein